MSKEAMKLALEALEKAPANTISQAARIGEAITALREMLAQPDQELVVDCPRCGHCCPQQPQQKPVAWAIIGDGEWGEYTYGMHFENSAAPNHKYWEVRGYELQPLYTAPQPAQRKPLTDAQIGAVAADIWGSVLIAPQSYQTFARAIEAAHGIKENT